MNQNLNEQFHTLFSEYWLVPQISNFHATKSKLYAYLFALGWLRSSQNFQKKHNICVNMFDQRMASNHLAQSFLQVKRVRELIFQIYFINFHIVLIHFTWSQPKLLYNPDKQWSLRSESGKLLSQEYLFYLICKCKYVT